MDSHHTENHEAGHGGDHSGPVAGRRGSVPASPARLVLRFGLACLVLAGAALALSASIVGTGTAVVVTQFGRPVRVINEPGLAWTLPTPIQTEIPVDLRLRTISSGLTDVGTRDGVRILVQAFVAWQVSSDPAMIERFVRAVRNDPDEAARQLRSFTSAALQVGAGSFALADLVNTDPTRVHLAALEARLTAQLQAQMHATYGIEVRQAGIERLSLPETTLAATVARMRSERETVAAQRTAEGLREAAQIRADAQRDSRIMVADGQTQAATIEAASRREAAEIQARAYSADPQLYMMLRSLDTLSSMIGPNTRLVLRTDAAPFNVLVQGPPSDAAGK